ncbi:MAG: AAA family ATPase [Phycisphaerales bacterium]|nr:AAA family ATPase [Phycisphaerales bacterium]
MRVIVTGQVGMEKKRYLEAASRLAGEQGEALPLYHVGDMMYREAPDVRPGRILDLPLSRLTTLRRAALKDIIAESKGQPNLLVNTHATFRWRHGLFSAFDFDQVRLLEPDLFVCLVDNIETVHHRLHAEHESDATLKDCMVWREEETLATELMSQAIPGSRFYLLSRGRHVDTTRTMFRLACRPGMKKVYPSFPMSHVMDLPDVLADIDRFRARLAEHFITFDPGDVDEKLLLERAIAAAREGKEFLEVAPHTFGGAIPGGTSLQRSESTAPGGTPLQRSASVPGGTSLQRSESVPGGTSLQRSESTALESGATKTPRVRVREVLDIAGDIDGQIYMRDFKLIDQSDMIVSYIPELPGGMPGLSSGVERELHHAFEHTKEVYVVWRPKKTPSPFITETATRIFPDVDAALAHFDSRGMFGERNLFGQ